MSQDSLSKLRTWMTEQGLDAFMVTEPQNRSYLSGWLNDDEEGSGLLLIDQQRQILLTNPLYKEIAEREASNWQVMVPTSREYAPAVVTQAQEHGWKTIGFESTAVTLSRSAKRHNFCKRTIIFIPMEYTLLITFRRGKQPLRKISLNPGLCTLLSTVAS